MPPYTKFTWIDEVLAGAARYDILENGGGAFKSNMQINLATTVTTPGSTFTAARLNNIEGEIQALSDLLNYKLAVSVAANDLIVTLQHADGTNPTSTRPLYFKIGGTWRAVTTTTTITIVDGTNWFNSGAAEFGTQLVGYFAYVVYDSNSSIVALTISRIPHARLVSDFSATTTNEKHCFNYANFTSTDNVENIGYFEATLSLVATSHLWTVPTFTNKNLVSKPTFESQQLTWVPQFTNLTVGNGTLTARYRMVFGAIQYQWSLVWGSTTAISGSVTHTLPFARESTFASLVASVGTLRFLDASATTSYAGLQNLTAASTAALVAQNASATYLTHTNLSSTIPFTWTTSDEIETPLIQYPI